MTAKTVVRADAVFEAALGLLLVGGVAADALDGSDFPGPAGGAVLVAVGALLILLAFALWDMRIGVRALAIGNALTAVAAVIWLAVGSGFSETGATVVAVTAIGLACLAAAQVATLRA